MPNTRCCAGTGHRAAALSQAQLQPGLPVDGAGLPAAQSCLDMANV